MVTFDPTGEIEQNIHPRVKEHPLCTNDREIREKLRVLAWDPDKLKRFEGGKAPSPPEEAIYDANRLGYLINRLDSPLCYPYIWSPFKKAFATFEKIRDEEGQVKTFDQTPYEEIIAKVIQKEGFGDLIATEVVSTAINIVPAADHMPLGKSWAAGGAVENIQQRKLGSQSVLDTVIDRTIAIGDGRADLDFTTPYFPPAVASKLQHSTIPIIFVGGEQDLPQIGSPAGKLRDNIIIRATGKGDLEYEYEKELIRLHSAKGPRVVSVILDFLKQWDYFRPF